MKTSCYTKKLSQILLRIVIIKLTMTPFTYFIISVSLNLLATSYLKRRLAGRFLISFWEKFIVIRNGQIFCEIYIVINICVLWCAWNTRRWCWGFSWKTSEWNGIQDWVWIQFNFLKYTSNNDHFPSFFWRYKLDNGEIFHGETLHFHDNAFMFFGANYTLYGISLTESERNSSSLFYTFARPGDFVQFIFYFRSQIILFLLVVRSEGKLIYSDDNRMFEFDIERKYVNVNNYLTK